MTAVVPGYISLSISVHHPHGWELIAVERIGWALQAVRAPGSMQQTRMGLCPSELACERLTKLRETWKSLGGEANPLVSLSSKSPLLSISLSRWKGTCRTSVLPLSKGTWPSRVRLLFFFYPLCTVLNFSKENKQTNNQTSTDTTISIQVLHICFMFWAAW